jgi:hypothetical protein
VGGVEGVTVCGVFGPVLARLVEAVDDAKGPGISLPARALGVVLGHNALYLAETAQRAIVTDLLHAGIANARVLSQNRKQGSGDKH